MKQSICPKCGQPSAEGLCSSCILKSTKILSCPNRVEVTVCPVCGAKLVKGGWQITDRTAEELAYEATSESLLVHSDTMNPDIDIQLMKRGATRYLARVSMKGSFRGISVEDGCDIPVKIILTACDRCCRIAGKYFESTIQIRGSSRPPTKAELDTCRNIASSMTEACYRNGDRLAFIQDIKDTEGGLDLVIGSTQLARQIARAIFDRYGGRTQESAKLVGKKDGNDIYRTTILVRFPILKRGDIISSKGTIFEVTGFDCRKTLLTSLEGDRRTSLKDEDIEGLLVLGNRADSKKAVVVAKDEKVLEILDPESYKTAVASRPRGMEVKEGEEVMVLRTGEGLIVLG